MVRDVGMLKTVQLTKKVNKEMKTIQRSYLQRFHFQCYSSGDFY